MQKVTAEIHLGKIKENALAFSRLTGVKVCAVVKADAYGHGAEEVVSALNGVVDTFAVSLIEEGLKIRIPACGKDILVLTPPLTTEEVYEAGVNGFVLTVSDLYTAKLIVNACEKYNLRARVHLKGNTGMNRYGMGISELGKTCKYLSTQKRVTVEGFYSHLYSFDRKVCETQRQKFAKMLAVCNRYFGDVTAHLSATYGALLGKKYAFDMVRIGIGLYGYFPLKSANLEKKISLKKAMSVYAYVAKSRKYSFGGAGYGLKKLPRQQKYLSVVRFGYADGFLRKKNNGVFGFSKHANKLCMDACLRFGRLPRGKKIPLLIDADKTAKETGTISYEVLCSATRRAERVYHYDE